MRTLKCPHCGEIFSKKDVGRNIKKYGVMECQNCFRELTVNDFEDYNPLFLDSNKDNKRKEAERY